MSLSECTDLYLLRIVKGVKYAAKIEYEEILKSLATFPFFTVKCF